jgi:exosortase family protein XrtM
MAQGVTTRRRRGKRRQSKNEKSTFHTWAKFLVVFALLFLVGSKFHQLTRERTATILVDALNAQPSAALINLVTPSEHARAIRNLIQGRTNILVGQGCDGLDCLLLLVSAMLAFPMVARKKAIGIAIGVPLLYGCNLLRITGLYYVQRHCPQYFQFMHVNVGQTFIIVVGCGFFLLFTGSLAREQRV